MSTLPLIDREINKNEEDYFKYAFSTFTDGSGSEIETIGEREFTRIGWRQMERVTAFLLDGEAVQKKDYFDVIVLDKKEDVGLSLKSKSLPGKKFKNLDRGGRVYMELANSPAKFWDEMRIVGLSEADFLSGKKADLFGKTLIKTLFKWQIEASKTNQQIAGKKINLNRSVFWCISMQEPTESETRLFKIHTFPLKFPNIKKWVFKSDRCLSGFDPINESEVLFDWYALSGGQLKYYPSTRNALHSTGEIKTIQLDEVKIIELIKRHWPRFNLA